MMRSVFIIMAICSCSQLYGQTGYLRKFTLTYDPGMSFVLVEPYLAIYPITSVSFSPIVHHNVNLAYTIKQKISIGLGASFTNGKFDHDYIDNYYSATPEIRDVSVGVQLRYYFTGITSTYAPASTYIGLGFNYGYQNTYRTDVIDYIDSTGFHSNSYHYYDDKVREKFIMISLYTGRNFVLKERLLLGYGIQFGFDLKFLEHPFNYSHEMQPMRYLAKPYLSIGYLF